MSTASKTWLRHPLTWLAVAAAALMGSIMTFSYIGGFLDPTGELNDAPLAVVNADQGAQVAGVQLDAGKQIEQELIASGGSKIDWQTLTSKEQAEKKLRDNELWGAIVIPEGFSAAVGQIGTSLGTSPPAELDVLTNEGSGLFQSSLVNELSAAAVTKTSGEISQQLVGLLGQSGASVTPAGAAAIGQPVVAKTDAVVELPEKAGRGIAPLYLAVMISLTGFLAASIANIGIDLMRGSEDLEIFGRQLNLRVPAEAGPFSLWATKAGLTALGAALGGALAVLTAVGILGMSVASAPKAYAVGILGAVAVGMVSQVFLTVFGLAGELVGVLFTTIFGVPSALGVYPAQAVPGIFAWIGSWHPLRYLTDALRSIAFFGASGAGLGKAVVVLSVWLVGSVLVGAGAAKLFQRRATAGAAVRARPVPVN